MEPRSLLQGSTLAVDLKRILRTASDVVHLRGDDMTDRQYEVLRALVYAREWMRPMDVGGRDASHHSRTLAQLVAKGWAERTERGSDHSFRYRATPAGVLSSGREQRRRLRLEGVVF